MKIGWQPCIFAGPVVPLLVNLGKVSCTFIHWWLRDSRVKLKSLKKA